MRELTDDLEPQLATAALTDLRGLRRKAHLAIRARLIDLGGWGAPGPTAPVAAPV